MIPTYGCLITRRHIQHCLCVLMGVTLQQTYRGYRGNQRVRYGEDSREEALSKQTLPFWTQLRVATWNIMGPMVLWFDANVGDWQQQMGIYRSQWPR